MTEKPQIIQQCDPTRSPSSYCSRVASILQLQTLRSRDQHVRRSGFATLPQPSQERLDVSLIDTPIDTEKLAASSFSILQEKEKTVLYLAYGSNLCNETFRGKRGIRPLAQVNVVVPSLRLTFDLPGIPYAEPCFANTARRNPDVSNINGGQAQGDDYHKDRWHKGLVGVVYEVTLADYAHIIATEGGGSAYHDILVDCHVLPMSDTVPTLPASRPFKAHTLFAPMLDDDESSQSTDRVSRPDPSYAQPSARYLKLITDGAAECHLPTEYQNYLHDVHAYTMTSRKQAAGKVLFLAIWMPFLLMLFALSKQFQDKKGRAPAWFGQFSAMLFTGIWMSYDTVFKGVFGDGERTMDDKALWKRGASVSGRQDCAEKEGLLDETVGAGRGNNLRDDCSWNRGFHLV